MIEENEQLPDWLIELRDEQLRQQSQEPPLEQVGRASLVGDLRPSMPPAGAPLAPAEVPVTPAEAPVAPAEEPLAEPEPAAPTDMLESLREQMILAAAAEELEYARRRTLVQTVRDLQPTQRLLLAVLLFLNVAVCGCMMLTMAGRVELPF